jgi:ABC-type lipoprotein release transport system permease subunit
MLKDGSATAQAATLAAVEELLGDGRPKPDAAVLTKAEAVLQSGRLPFTLTDPLSSLIAAERARLAGKASSSAAARTLEDGLRAAKRNLLVADVETLEALLASAKPQVWVLDWATASGFLGQFIGFFRLLLVALLAAFAFFSLIVVTIGVTIATLQRTSTIGTMRAIGAQREFVIALVVTETLVLSVAFGLLGSALGCGAVAWMHSSGIPAFRDELYFFFSGPVLRPEITASSIVTSVIATMVVSLLAVLFPVILATRVSPLVAMQSSEA